MPPGRRAAAVDEVGTAPGDRPFRPDVEELRGQVAFSCARRTPDQDSVMASLARRR
jgi:hypothetical protein